MGASRLPCRILQAFRFGGQKTSRLRPGISVFGALLGALLGALFGVQIGPPTGFSHTPRMPPKTPQAALVFRFFGALFRGPESGKWVVCDWFPTGLSHTPRMPPNNANRPGISVSRGPFWGPKLTSRASRKTALGQVSSNLAMLCPCLAVLCPCWASFGHLGPYTVRNWPKTGGKWPVSGNVAPKSANVSHFVRPTPPEPL